MTRARTGFLGDFAAGFLAGLFFGVAFFAAGFRTAGFLAAAFLAAGFLAAGLRLAAAMADVSPVPSEGERALAVDSRTAAPQNDATAGSTCTRARPGNRAARKPPAAPGSPRSTGAQTQRSSNYPDDPAGALRSTRQEKAASSPRHCPRDRGVCLQLIQRSRCGPRMFIHVTRALIGSMLLRPFTARCSANWIAAARVLLEQIVCKRFASTLIVKRF